MEPMHPRTSSRISNVTEQTGLLDSPKMGSVQSMDGPKYKSPGSSRGKRILSLDVLRGLTLFFMVFVNMASEGTYGFMHHAHWNWPPSMASNLADFCFPFFVFMVGVSLIVAMHVSNAFANRTQAFLRAFVRALKMFLLGVFVINAFDVVCGAVESGRYPGARLSGPQCFLLPLWDFANMRIPGVLQRIAIAFLTTVAIVLFVPQLRISPPRPVYGGISIVERAIYWLKRDILQWLTVFAILALYLGLLLAWDVPGCGMGHLTPQCNAAQYIDEQFWGKAHMYLRPTCLPDCPYFDPEGILGDLTAIVTCFLGVHIGRMLIDLQDFQERLRYGVFCSGLWLGLGILMHETWIPINKNLWSPSYVFFMCGSATAILLLLTWLIDERGIKTPFVPLMAMGMNSIAIYAGSETLPNLLGMFFYKDTSHNGWYLASQVIYGWAKEPVAGLLWSFVVASFWVGVGSLLYWRGIFFKI